MLLLRHRLNRTHYNSLLSQEAALHQKLHPHASVCGVHTESHGCLHQGRGPV